MYTYRLCWFNHLRGLVQLLQIPPCGASTLPYMAHQSLKVASQSYLTKTLLGCSSKIHSFWSLPTFKIFTAACFKCHYLCTALPVISWNVSLRKFNSCRSWWWKICLLLDLYTRTHDEAVDIQSTSTSPFVFLSGIQYHLGEAAVFSTYITFVVREQGRRLFALLMNSQWWRRPKKKR